MYEVAKKLMSAAAKSLSSGRASSDIEIRIGMWPCISTEAPQAAMGLMASLALLLERWPEISVYRVFAWLDGEPEAYHWTLQQSQFTPDDWAFDGLNDNVGLWGTLDRDETGQWQFRLTLENDLSDDSADETLQEFSFRAVSLNELITSLPEIAAQIAIALDLPVSKERRQVYGKQYGSEGALKDLLESAFQWELQILLGLWGVPMDIKEAHARLIESGRAVGDDFAGWLVALSSERALNPEFTDVSDHMLPLQNVSNAFPDSPWAQIIIGRAMYNSGAVPEGMELLSTVVRQHPTFAEGWLTLASAYSRGGRVKDAVQVLQSAMTAQVESARIYALYGQLCAAIDRQSLKISAFKLIDVDSQMVARPTAWEAISAYEEAVALDAVDEPLHRLNQILLLVTMDDPERLGEVFEALVRADSTGEQVRTAIDEMYALDDLEEGVHVLRSASSAQPERIDLKLNLAAMCIAAGDYDLAVSTLNDLDRDSLRVADAQELDRLWLMANDPEFEASLGEIIDKISAQTPLADSEVDFLESAVGEAPYYSELYVLLARAYLLWEDSGAALEVLLDAEKRTDDADVIELLAQQLWQGDQHDLAMQYLERGLQQSPHHVSLLALAGQIAADLDAFDDAREFLLRAEGVNPNHPALQRARTYIARLMQE